MDMNDQLWSLHHDVMPNSEAVFTKLEQEVAWETRTIKIFGKVFEQPRLIAWQGEQDYSYSGGLWKASSFSKSVLSIKEEIESITNTQFNGVLLNMYRDGKDSMGWHSDNEKELGESPIVASVTFGAERRFRIREKANRKNSFSIDLKHNSLLFMRPGFQNTYEHSIPKSSKAVGKRINLTFRQII